MCNEMNRQIFHYHTLRFDLYPKQINHTNQIIKMFNLLLVLIYFLGAVFVQSSDSIVFPSSSDNGGSNYYPRLGDVYRSEPETPAKQLECGIIEQNLTDPRTKVPWLAGIFLRERKANGLKTWKFLFSGTIIGPQAILTINRRLWESIHGKWKLNLPDVKDLFVGVGLKSTNLLEIDEFSQIAEVVYVHPHTKFNEATRAHDVAILHLKSSLNLTSSFARAACLPIFKNSKSVKEKNFLVPGTIATHGGFDWHSTSVRDGNEYRPLKIVKIKIQAYQHCLQEFRKLEPDTPYYLYCARLASRRLNEHNNLCVYYGSSPVVPIGPDHKYYIIGINSVFTLTSSNYTCDRSSVNWFSRLNGSLTWIQNDLTCGPYQWTCGTYNQSFINQTSPSTVISRAIKVTKLPLLAQCIPLSKVCDQSTECIEDGGSDEDPLYCRGLNPCKPNQFECGVYGRCIDPSDLCNGRDDCGNGLDEDPSGICKGKQSANAFDEQSCTVYPSDGLRIDCDDPERRVPIECTGAKRVPIGTRASYSCEKYYLPTINRKSVVQRCEGNGQWYPPISFNCFPDCGKAEKALNLLIVNGTLTRRDSWPWHVAIFKYIPEESTFLYTCGGTIIHNSAVLSAAHCFIDENGQFEPESKFKIVLAPVSSDFVENMEDTHAQVVDIVKYTTPTEFNTRNYHSDIAVLQLKPIKFNDYTRPVCFTSASEEHRRIENYQLNPGTIGQVIGFGVDESLGVSHSLKFANLPVISSKDCFVSLMEPPHESTYCAGWQNGTSVCNGDSGGAMVFSSGTGLSPKYFIQGIVSHGPRLENSVLCNSHTYAVYTRVGFFSDWIQTQLHKIEYGSLYFLQIKGVLFCVHLLNSVSKSFGNIEHEHEVSQNVTNSRRNSGTTISQQQIIVVDSGSNGGKGKQCRPHPLDPLTWNEHKITSNLIQQKYVASQNLFFISIDLQEPKKSDYKAYQKNPRKCPIRKSFSVILDTKSGYSYEVTVNLKSKSIESFHKLPQGTTPQFKDKPDVELVESVINSDQNVKERLAKLGLSDPKQLYYETWDGYGYDYQDESSTKPNRISFNDLFFREFKGDNKYAHPLDFGVVVDEISRKVIKIVEIPTSSNTTGPRLTRKTLPRETANYDPIALPTNFYRTPLEPIELVGEKTFKLKGRQVLWDNFQFRIGFNSREGIVLHDIHYKDGKKLRPIIYRMALSEMVVPYGEPRIPYQHKAAMDAGSFGLGFLSNSLKRNVECPQRGQLLDAILNGAKGVPFIKENAICIYEADDGLLFKHVDIESGYVAVKSSVLTILFISTVGNSDYEFIWKFSRNGNIDFQVSLTGLLDTHILTQGTNPYSLKILPKVIAPFHQHIFSSRIDFMVDGEQNTVATYDVLQVPDKQNPYGNGIFTQITKLNKSSQVTDTKIKTDRTWLITNPNVKNRITKEPVAWRLIPTNRHLAYSKLSSRILKRAGFAKHSLWVTQYRDSEKYAAGPYPAGSLNDGLPKYIKRDESVLNRDIVVWHTFGLTHIPRLEDFPIMPVEKIGFTLKPFGFFTRNPALDIPPEENVPEVPTLSFRNFQSIPLYPDGKL